MEDAELHSVGRWPQPRCHPGTRVDITKRIHTWLTDEDREQNMLWLSGPAGVGKTAVTQTIGERRTESRKLIRLSRSEAKVVLTDLAGYSAGIYTMLTMIK